MERECISVFSETEQDKLVYFIKLSLTKADCDRIYAELWITFFKQFGTKICVTFNFGASPPSLYCSVTKSHQHIIVTLMLCIKTG